MAARTETGKIIQGVFLIPHLPLKLLTLPIPGPSGFQNSSQNRTETRKAPIVIFYFYQKIENLFIVGHRSPDCALAALFFR